ncbi:hypothetical protein BCV69DRAFT_300790 [Microstroma glucosiphilum]|uniref:Zn(2)-C6 fungal-type domain-containing protein n=1 Tax=Pseudomicrostroma glucosiphilum TaxID=1684307 RepID=A0A316U7S4_9BASI|nr:hypothetical protein BCV69DRAFT_300790 [Pseudomicrostroma glucosiphilum]PWN19005.1 hypothetical protein BCV69DRAFT_300790 [Pseudomicrostroma glucosiphilum]
MATLNSAGHTQQYRMDHLHIGIGGHQNEPEHYHEGQFQPRQFEIHDRQYQAGSDLERPGNSGRSTPIPAVPSSAELLSLYGPKPIRAQFACDYCRVRKAKCSGTEPCDRCISKKRVCTFSSVQNQRKVTRSLKDLRAERTIGSPCRSPVSAVARAFPDVGPQSPYIRVGSGVGRRTSPNDPPNSATFRRNDLGPLPNANARSGLSLQSSGTNGWPYDWDATPLPQESAYGGPRRVHQPQAIGVQNQLHYLQPHQQHYLNSPGLDMTQSPLSAGGHFYSAQSSPTFFQHAGQSATPAMNAFSPSVQGGAGLGPTYSNAHYYAGIGQGDLTTHGLSSLHLQQQHFQPRMNTQSQVGESSGSGSDDVNRQQGWREGPGTLTVGNGDCPPAGGQNMFSASNEALSQQSQMSTSHTDVGQDASSKEEQQTCDAEQSSQLQSGPLSADDGNCGNSSVTTLKDVSNNASCSKSLSSSQGSSHSQPDLKAEPKVDSPSGHDFTPESLSVYQGQSATQY